MDLEVVENKVNVIYGQVQIHMVIVLLYVNALLKYLLVTCFKTIGDDSFKMVISIQGKYVNCKLLNNAYSLPLGSRAYKSQCICIEFNQIT